MSCNRDCFRCPFPDCIEDDISPEEAQASEERDERILRERRDKQRAYMQDYYQANRDRLLRMSRERYWAEPELCRAKSREYYRRNAERIKARVREYKERMARNGSGVNQGGAAPGDPGEASVSERVDRGRDG